MALRARQTAPGCGPPSAPWIATSQYLRCLAKTLQGPNATGSPTRPATPGSSRQGSPAASSGTTLPAPSRRNTPPVANVEQHRKLRSRKTQDTLRNRRPALAPLARPTRARHRHNSRSWIDAQMFPRVDAQRRNPSTKVDRQNAWEQMKASRSRGIRGGLRSSGGTGRRVPLRGWGSESAERIS